MDLLERRRMMMGAGDILLPAAYVRFRGTQNLDLEITGDNTTSIIVNFSINTLVSGAARSFLGYYDPSNSTTRSLNLFLGYGGASTRYGTASCSLDWRQGYTYTMTLTPTGWKRQGYRSQSGSWSTSAFETAGTLKMGYTGTGNYYMGNVYSCIISKGGVDVLNLVPVYNQTKGEYGLKDLLTGKLYGSITGTPLEGSLT